MFTDEYAYELDMQVKAEEAYEKGAQNGAQQKAVETATNMLIKKYPTSDICEITGLPLEQVLELQKTITVKA
jgi:predicted transposase/invertase (TIGR01784 family)